MRSALCIGLLVATAPLAQPAGNAGNDVDAGILPADLDWQPINGSERQIATRFGLLTVDRGEQCAGTREPAPQLEIRFEGALVQALPCLDGDYYIASFRNAFALGPVDIVILGATGGGSGSPPQRLHLVIVDPASGPRLETDPDFRSVDWTENVASDGNRLWFDLGYDEGNRKTAVFAAGGLRIDRTPAAPTPLSDEICRSVRGALQDCRARANGRDLAGYSISRLIDDYRLLSTASRNVLRAVSHHPGFSGDEFVLACGLMSEAPAVAAYDQFAEAVCRP
jgi:hypothetical protein